MKLLFENWREFLKEASPAADLGKYAFPNNKIRTGPALARWEEFVEEDTELERYLINVLRKHFHDSIPFNQDVADVLKSFIENEQYGEVFQRYQKGKVYRGLGLQLEEFHEIFGPRYPKGRWSGGWHKAPLKYLNKLWRHVAYDEKPTASADLEAGSPESIYSPLQRDPDHGPSVPAITRSSSSSWTSDLIIAQDFAFHFRENYIPIIYVANSSDPENYFIDAGPLYDYNFAAALKDEDEVISIGDIELLDAMWFLDYGPGGQPWE